MATFTFTPSYPVQLSQQPKVVTTKFGDSYEQRQAVGLNNNLKTWTFVFKNREDTEKNNIISFFNTEGGVTSFDYTDPDGVAGKYICRQWRWQQTAFNLNTINAVFEEVAEV
tara:strand:+ start:290 stop:625 length:336 start_codon:yes stop_codon:yes gene_type:complete